MVYFEPNTGWPEQLGKIIGDAFAAAVVVSVLIFCCVEYGIFASGPDELIE